MLTSCVCKTNNATVTAFFKKYFNLTLTDDLDPGTKGKCNITKNTHVKYESAISYHSKVTANVNPLPHIPILGSLNSTANKDMMAKIWTQGDTIICLS